MNTFALADLVDNVYITRPPMYRHDSLSKKDFVLKLNIYLYGLVQAPKFWYDKISSELYEIGIKTYNMDQWLFYKVNIAALVYVDDVMLRNID